jgi:hypothetical protein
MKPLLILACGLSLLAFGLLAAPIDTPTSGPHRAARAAPVLRAPSFALAGATPWMLMDVPRPALLSGEALAHRLDDQIPTELYAEAAHCYRGGLPSDRTLDLSYRIHVKDGDLTVTEAGVTASKLDDDGALERCIVDRILSYRAREGELPDLDEEGEVFMRIGGFKPFLAQVADDGDEPLHL